MRLFSIKELERFSDIKAHTIRTWEKRYGIFNPQRTTGNIRHYLPGDVQLLLNISLLAELGFKISRLQQLKEHEFQQRILTIKSDALRQRANVYRLIIRMYGNDTDEFEAVLDESLMAWGIDATIEKIIIPFLERTDILSYKDSSVEVHFAVTAIRRKLILGIERTKPVAPTAKTALLFLPKGEHFDLVLLYMCYVLKHKGIKVLYLGTNISIDNLKLVYKDKLPDNLYCYMAVKNTFPINEYITFVQENIPGECLYVTHAENKAPYADNEHICLLNYKDMGGLLS